MVKKLLRLISVWLLQLSYEKLTLDKLNQKLIRPVVREGHSLIISGEQYYEFANLADMPDSRFTHFLDFDQEFSMGMDRETIIDYCRKIREANNKSDASKIGSLAFMLEDSVANCTPVQAMYNLASLLYFTQREDLRCYDGDFNQEKIKEFKKLPDQAFFLTRLLEHGLKIPGDKLPPDMQDYLRRSVVKLSAYARIRSGMKEGED